MARILQWQEWSMARKLQWQECSNDKDAPMARTPLCQGFFYGMDAHMARVLQWQGCFYSKGATMERKLLWPLLKLVQCGQTTSGNIKMSIGPTMRLLSLRLSGTHKARKGTVLGAF
jgi:hypothetical protein